MRDVVMGMNSIWALNILGIGTYKKVALNSSHGSQWNLCCYKRHGDGKWLKFVCLLHSCSGMVWHKCSMCSNTLQCQPQCAPFFQDGCWPEVTQQAWLAKIRLIAVYSNCAPSLSQALLLHTTLKSASHVWAAWQSVSKALTNVNVVAIPNTIVIAWVAIANTKVAAKSKSPTVSPWHNCIMHTSCQQVIIKWLQGLACKMLCSARARLAQCCYSLGKALSWVLCIRTSKYREADTIAVIITSHWYATATPLSWWAVASAHRAR